MKDNPTVQLKALSTSLSSLLTIYEEETMERRVTKVFGNWLHNSQSKLSKLQCQSLREPDDEALRNALEACRSIVEGVTILARGGCKRDDIGVGPENGAALDVFESSLISQIVATCACEEKSACELIDAAIAATKEKALRV